MSTHDDYHKSRKMQVGDHLRENKGSLKKTKCISWSVAEFRQQWCINENSTQVYTMSTHDDYHKNRKMQVGDHLV